MDTKTKALSLRERLQRRIEEARESEDGFTLMEMLIVVAIIAVLIAIAIPIFTSQLENSRESTDAANLRSAYAVASARVLTEGGTKGIAAGPVALTQAQANWQNPSLQGQKIGTLTISNDSVPSSGNAYVNVDTDGTVTITGSAATGFTTVDPTGAEPASAGNNG